MAVHAVTHGQVNGAYNHSLLGHIPVTTRASDFRADVRCMVESDMGARDEAVNALPRDIFPARRIGGNFPDLGPVGGDGLVAGHANFGAGDGRVRALIDTDVTVDASYPLSQMDLVAVGDGLDGCRTPAEEVPQSVEKALM